MWLRVVFLQGPVYNFLSRCFNNWFRVYRCGWNMTKNSSTCLAMLLARTSTWSWSTRMVTKSTLLGEFVYIILSNISRLKLNLTCTIKYCCMDLVFFSPFRLSYNNMIWWFCRPREMFMNRFEVDRVLVKNALKIDANHLIVVYRQEEEQIQRRIVQGPTIYVPDAHEWWAHPLSLCLFSVSISPSHVFISPLIIN